MLNESPFDVCPQCGKELPLGGIHISIGNGPCTTSGRTTQKPIDLNAYRQSKEPGFKLTLPFDTDDPEFARGFELGLLYGRLDTKSPTWEGTYKSKNFAMIASLADSLGYDVAFTATEDPTWIHATFVRRSG